uniref:Lipoprotein-releasing system ATP-binding protein LolD n=1 Tax=Anthurium amnicola TaxID=1678845 RepID=A0A1D1YER4_9ARAE
MLFYLSHKSISIFLLPVQSIPPLLFRHLSSSCPHPPIGVIALVITAEGGGERSEARRGRRRQQRLPPVLNLLPPFPRPSLPSVRELSNPCEHCAGSDLSLKPVGMEAAGGPTGARKKGGGGGLMEGFSPVSPPRIFWNSRKRSANGRSLEKAMEEESCQSKEEANTAAAEAVAGGHKQRESPIAAVPENPNPELSDRRRALFEPLGPADTATRTSIEELLPPPDFDAASYPKGWLVGKKRKLVNVDVVESMRRIAVQEMNRKVSSPWPP